MENDKNISIKNYILLAIILIITIILVTYFYMWYGTYKENKLTTPIMDKYMQVINYNELNNYLVENKNAVIYSSVLGNKEIRNFESKLEKLITDSSLKGIILYLNLTSEIKDRKINKELKEKYSLNDKDITDTPSFMIFKEGKLVSIYNVKDDNYNINELRKYLEESEVIDD